MSSYREAISHARSGGTARLGEKEIRFLTTEEAEPILLEQLPERRIVIDEATGKAKTTGKGKNEQIVVETIAPPNYNTKRLGLYDVGSGVPVPFALSDEDVFVCENDEPKVDEEGNRVLCTDWVREGIDLSDGTLPASGETHEAPTEPPTLALDDEPL